MIIVEGSLLPVTRTLDGQVIVHGPGALNALIDCPAKI